MCPSVNLAASIRVERHCATVLGMYLDIPTAMIILNMYWIHTWQYSMGFISAIPDIAKELKQLATAKYKKYLNTVEATNERNKRIPDPNQT